MLQIHPLISQKWTAEQGVIKIKVPCIYILIYIGKLYGSRATVNRVIMRPYSRYITVTLKRSLLCLVGMQSPFPETQTTSTSIQYIEIVSYLYTSCARQREKQVICAAKVMLFNALIDTVIGSRSICWPDLTLQFTATSVIIRIF